MTLICVISNDFVTAILLNPSIIDSMNLMKISLLILYCKMIDHSEFRFIKLDTKLDSGWYHSCTSHIDKCGHATDVDGSMLNTEAVKELKFK